MKNLTSYFRLKKINAKLLEENVYLKSLLIDENYKSNYEYEKIDSPYSLILGHVIKNNISSNRNIIIINKGGLIWLKKKWGLLVVMELLVL